MASITTGYVGQMDPGTGTKHAIGSTAYGECSIAAGTAAKTVEMTGFTLITGATVHVKFTNSNTASNPTLNINGTGAKSIVRYGTTKAGTTAETSWTAGSVVSFTYDGTNWVINDFNESVTYESKAAASGGTDLSLVTTGEKYNWNSASSGGVTNVAYDSTNKKITKTVGGNTSDVVTVATLKNDMALNNVENKSSATIRGELTSANVTAALGYTPPQQDTNTHRPIKMNGTQILGDNTTALGLTAGDNVTLSNSSGTVTIAATDTTYESKTAASGGTAVSLVTTGEKYTWNNKGTYSKPSGGIPDSDIASAATWNAKGNGTITGITMNGASKGTSGVVDLGTVITAHQDISGKADKTATVSTVAYDTTNKKITKTINGTTSDVVSAATLKTDMALSNVENKSSATIRGELTSANVTTALGYTPPQQDTNTHRPIQVDGTQILGDNTTALNLVAGDNISLTNSSGSVTVASTLVDPAIIQITFSTLSSLPITFYDSAITSEHVVLHYELSNKSAQTGDWTCTTADGSLTITGSCSGVTNIIITLGIPSYSTSYNASPW